MTTPVKPIAVNAADVAPRPKSTVYPPPFAARVDGRIKAALGNVFGLTNFGVNLTRLKPGAQSALRHAHKTQDEFVYVLEGEPALVTNAGETLLKPGMCAGFKAGNGDAHHLVNRSESDVVYLEIGDRTPGDEAFYPDDDIHISAEPDGKFRVTRKDGTPFAYTSPRQTPSGLHQLINPVREYQELPPFGKADSRARSWWKYCVYCLGFRYWRACPRDHCEYSL